MMLHYVADHSGDKAAETSAKKIREAYEKSLREGAKTRDLGGQLSTEQFADAVIQRL
jgi:isocitrate/isopropylmalate dehydrogenase